MRKRKEVELENTMISLSRQCELLGINRSSFYYRSRRDEGYNNYLMRLIDEQFTRRPTYFTYIRLLHGFVYLVVVMDWFSRYVLSWKLSITLEKEFCLEALREALMVSTHEIFNSDQGSQFTSSEFTGILKNAGIRISMDGRGRLYDNIFVERLWRTVKYEEVYLNDYISVPAARKGLGALRYFVWVID